MPQTFGETIRAARLAREWSQMDLAVKLREVGVRAAASRVSHWENDRGKPAARALAALINVLELDPAAVLETVGRWPGWSSGSRGR